MIARVLALSAALVLSTNVAALAQDDEEEEFYYEKESSSYVALTASGGSIEGDETGGFGVIVGVHLDTFWALEGQYDYIDDSQTHLGSFGTKFVALADSPIQPYVRVGVGLMGGRPDSSFRLMTRFGGGVAFFLTETLAIDAGATAAVVVDDDNLYLGTLGLTYYFE